MIIPILRIFDLEKAKEFYCDYLGFEKDWEHQFEEGMPLYLQISLEGIIIHLSEHHGDASPGSAIRIRVSDLKNYHSTLAKKDYAYARPGIEEAPWGMDELTIIDPFSNRIIFYQEHD